MAIAKATYVQVACEPATDTIYVTNANGNTVSVINGATCNAQTISGCAQSAPVPVEQLPDGIAVDQQTDAAYITSIVDGDVSRTDGRACTPTHIPPDCRSEPIPARIGGWGMAIALDPTAGTAYVPNNDDDTVSMFAFWRRGPVDAACRS
jgi:hypothetical protein